MEHPQSEERRVASMKRCSQVVYHIGQEAKGLSESFKSVPTHLALIDGIADETKRREAKAVVRDTKRDLMSLQGTQQCAISVLEELYLRLNA